MNDVSSDTLFDTWTAMLRGLLAGKSVGALVAGLKMMLDWKEKEKKKQLGNKKKVQFLSYNWDCL